MVRKRINDTLNELDAAHGELVELAHAAKDRFWEEAKNSGRTMYHGVAISEKGKYIDIYWFKMAYKRHEYGPQEKPFKTRVAKGRAFRFSRKAMGKMEVSTEWMFNRYEDEFEVLRELISRNKKAYRDLSKMKSIIERKLYDGQEL